MVQENVRILYGQIQPDADTTKQKRRKMRDRDKENEQQSFWTKLRIQLKDIKAFGFDKMKNHPRMRSKGKKDDLLSFLEDDANMHVPSYCVPEPSPQDKLWSGNAKGCKETQTEELVKDDVIEVEAAGDPIRINTTDILMHEAHPRMLENMREGESIDGVCVRSRYSDLLHKTILIKYKESNIPCYAKVKPDTIVLGSKEETEYYVYYNKPVIWTLFADSPRQIDLTVAFILNGDYEKIFSVIPNGKNKLNAVRSFNKLTPKRRDFVLEQVRTASSMPKSQEKRELFMPIQDKEQLRMLYDLAKNSYTKETQGQIETLFEEMGPFSRDHDSIKKLSFLLGIRTIPVRPPKRSYDEIIEIMDRFLEGRQRFKQDIAEAVIEAQFSGDAFFSCLTCGSPGVGKTAIAEMLAAVYDCPVVKVPCASATSISINGLVSSYSDAQPGSIATGLRAAGTTNVILLLDEIDKMNERDKDGTAYAALITLLDNSHILHDEFCGDIDISGCKIICTGNQLKDIPDYIRSRFEDRVYLLEDYDAEEKARIGMDYVLPQEMKKRGMTEEDVRFTPEAMLFLAQRTSDAGAREITGLIKSVLKKIIVDWNRGTASRPMVIDIAYIEKRLGSSVKHAKRQIGFTV